MEWDELSMRDRAELIRKGVSSGVTDLSKIREMYGSGEGAEAVQDSEESGVGQEQQAQEEDAAAAIKKYREQYLARKRAELDDMLSDMPERGTPMDYMEYFKNKFSYRNPKGMEDSLEGADDAFMDWMLDRKAGDNELNLEGDEIESQEDQPWYPAFEAFVNGGVNEVPVQGESNRYDEGGSMELPGLFGGYQFSPPVEFIPELGSPFMYASSPSAIVTPTKEQLEDYWRRHAPKDVEMGTFISGDDIDGIDGISQISGEPLETSVSNTSPPPRLTADYNHEELRKSEKPKHSFWDNHTSTFDNDAVNFMLQLVPGYSTVTAVENYSRNPGLVNLLAIPGNLALDLLTIPVGGPVGKVAAKLGINYLRKIVNKVGYKQVERLSDAAARAASKKIKNKALKKMTEGAVYVTAKDVPFQLAGEVEGEFNGDKLLYDSLYSLPYANPRRPLNPIESISGREYLEYTDVIKKEINKDKNKMLSSFGR